MRKFNPRNGILWHGERAGREGIQNTTTTTTTTKSDD